MVHLVLYSNKDQIPAGRRAQIVPTTRWQYNSKNCMATGKTVPVEGNVADEIKQAFKVSGVSWPLLSFTDALCRGIIIV